MANNSNFCHGCSFFHWFDDTQQKDIDDINDEVCPLPVCRLLVMIYHVAICLFFLGTINFSFGNMQIAELIKEDLWPNPLNYFNNVLDCPSFFWMQPRSC